jgi:hypothetical protein
MKLADIRKMAIRQQTKVRFRLANGLECEVDEHGLARMPGIRDAPQFTLEEELAVITEFELETAPPAKSGPRKVSRAELEKALGVRPEAAEEEHDE